MGLPMCPRPMNPTVSFETIHSSRTSNASMTRQARGASATSRPTTALAGDDAARDQVGEAKRLRDVAVEGRGLQEIAGFVQLEAGALNEDVAPRLHRTGRFDQPPAPRAPGSFARAARISARRGSRLATTSTGRPSAAASA